MDDAKAREDVSTEERISRSSWRGSAWWSGGWILRRTRYCDSHLSEPS